MSHPPPIVIELLKTKEELIDQYRASAHREREIADREKEVTNTLYGTLRKEVDLNFQKTQILLAGIADKQSAGFQFLVQQFADLRKKAPGAIKKDLDKILSEGVRQ